MFFTVLSHYADIPSNANNKAYLLIDGWDDCFKFATMYVLFYCDGDGQKHRIGEVKIGQFGLTPEQRKPPIPETFDTLEDDFFSLGQDDTYYEKAYGLGIQVRDSLLDGLRDVAFNEDELFNRALKEEVMGVSLLRSVSRSSVRGQFRRMANGGARLTRYSFSYEPPHPKTPTLDPVKFTFDVDPGSNPPTNIHVLIGRNGVGKTHHLELMTRALVERDSAANEVGTFKDLSIEDHENSEPIFENIISVTFSAFDPFKPRSVRQNKSEGVRYQYIGLKHISDKTKAPKTPSRLGQEFGASVKLVTGQIPKLERWRKALSVLEADPIFYEANISALADKCDDEKVKCKAASIFSKLSSGHKIVLLTITRLVETVEEKTLVLLDEPEAHLHPPLLSAFVRSLSELLSDRNGVALIATHSPVVLQEVPKHCVWKLRRSGHVFAIERPDVQTFGENVGILTREVFGLEVTDSGFHQLLTQAVRESRNYDNVVKIFNRQLGAEARAIVQGMIASIEQDGED